MKKARNPIVIALTLIITLTLMLSTTAITLADTADQSTTYISGGFAQAIKEKLDNLVTSGTITQDQETAVQNALTPSSDGTTTSQRHDRAQGIKGNLDGLVSAGTITQDQETAVQEALTPSSDGTTTSQRHDRAQGIKGNLDGLVSAGTITQDQETAIQEALTPSDNGTGMHQATKGIVLRIGQSKMTVNGTSQDIDPGYQTAPVIIKDKTFIPIRAIIESLGGTVGWSASDQKITITVNNIPIVLQIGNNKATVNGTEKAMDDAPFISSTGRTMLPLRFITENLGHTVNWDDSTKTISIQ